jgi:hypothetical protein
MISPISHVTPAQPAAKAAPEQPATSTATPKSSADTVQISNSAKALLQETLETSVQTGNEARGGDIQAMRLLARQAAAKASAK